METSNLTYNVDIVMCIDCTGSMQGLIEKVKQNAFNFYPDLKKYCESKDKHIDQMRVRVIGFRDFYADGPKAIESSGFFKIPEEEEEFKRFVENLQAYGGGDEPENGLEALTLAINSPWTKEGNKKRHVIVVWTDASTHPLEEPKTKNQYYPENMPKDFNELTDLWDNSQGGMSKAAKRLVLFAPDANAWSDIGVNWDNTVHHTSKAGYGLEEFDYEIIMAVIGNSI